MTEVKEHTAGSALETGRTDAYITDDVLLYGLISTAKILNSMRLLVRSSSTIHTRS